MPLMDGKEFLSEIKSDREVSEVVAPSKPLTVFFSHTLTPPLSTQRTQPHTPQWRDLPVLVFTSDERETVDADIIAAGAGPSPAACPLVSCRCHR